MPIYPTPLQELLRLSFSDSPHWLSGSQKAAILVSWIAVSLEEVQTGDLLLLEYKQASPEILSLAGKRGAVAALILGSSEEPWNSGSGLPVAVLSGKHSLRTTQQALLVTLINQHAGLVERSLSIHEQLLQLTAEDAGLAGLVRAMADLSGKSVLLQDKRLRPLAECPSPIISSIWADVVMHLEQEDSLPEPLRDRKQAGKQSLIFTQAFSGGLERLITSVNVGDVARGYLSLIGWPGELDQLDRLVAEQGARVSGIEMARAKAIHEAEKRLKGDLITALLEENLSPRDISLWAQTMGLDLDQSYLALRFAWNGPSPPSRRRLETLINGEITRQNLKVVVNPLGVEVVCFFPVESSSGRPESALSFAQSVINQEAGMYPDCIVLCGVGLPCQDLSDWRDSFRQAGQALEMARRLGERKPLYFPDLSVYRLLLQIEHNPELGAFLEQMLGPLMAYEGGRELIHTLEAYFDHNGNLSQTAEALFIHRNTLVYRMERVEEILDLDLDRPDTRLALQLALHIARMTGNLQSDG
jgi:purine catabolism regulator